MAKESQIRPADFADDREGFVRTIFPRNMPIRTRITPFRNEYRSSRSDREVVILITANKGGRNDETSCTVNSGRQVRGQRTINPEGNVHDTPQRTSNFIPH